MALDSDGADFGNLGIPQPHLRDVDADELRAINVTIASYLDVGTPAHRAHFDAEAGEGSQDVTGTGHGV